MHRLQIAANYREDSTAKHNSFVWKHSVYRKLRKLPQGLPHYTCRQINLVKKKDKYQENLQYLAEYDMHTNTAKKGPI